MHSSAFYCLVLPLQLSAEGLSVKGISIKEEDDGADSEENVVLPSPKDHPIRRPELLGKRNVVENHDPAFPSKDDPAGESKIQNNSDFELHDLVMEFPYSMNFYYVMP